MPSYSPSHLPDHSPSRPFRRSLRRFIFSDAHILASYSSWKQTMSLVHSGIRQHDETFCLGDAIEFMHPFFKSTKEILQTAEDTIDSFMEVSGSKPFHWFVGNHDCVAEMVDVLNAKAGEYENFHWHSDELVAGNAVYCHGHTLIGEGGIKAGQQMPGRMPTRFVPAEDMLYPLGKRIIHSVAGHFGPLISTWPQFYPVEPTLKLAAARADQIPAVQKSGAKIKHVFMGHMHTPNGIISCKVGGKDLHVTGASVRTLFQSHALMLTAFENDQGDIVDVDTFGVAPRRNYARLRALQRWDWLRKRGRA